MSSTHEGAALRREGQRQEFWRSSLYEEPMWIAVAWILGPILLAVIAIYFAAR